MNIRSDRTRHKALGHNKFSKLTYKELFHHKEIHNGAFMAKMKEKSTTGIKHREVASCKVITVGTDSFPSGIAEGSDKELEDPLAGFDHPNYKHTQELSRE